MRTGRRHGWVPNVNHWHLPVISPDGRLLAVPTANGVVELWELSPYKPLPWFVAAAVGLALPLALVAWWRSRRLRRKAA
ncbi:MAG TPA: hypothetical protein VH120_21145 [Gemmataceae bacterium]|nr:hypothetical protein [Gemmataceae bacterium]